ncbi:hypothetical protein NON00_17970 [Roseomonas sp. GC11]|uniref:hypothetical protein n=1 Tax=Roseomonas sp. GC11 TaxID=2950546 RepID=UPI00210A19BE|nr:hypothetical protein [Roseomonas sp. GC11]MCQ4161803.1 hypothetical protein [Roseomonas sp. GC11]
MAPRSAAQAPARRKGAPKPQKFFYSSFSEEKEAKRLSFRLPPSPGTAGRQTEKSFLVLFYKKEPL